MYSDNYWISIFDAVPTWVMLLPIFICSIIGAAAIIERILLYNRINADYTMLINNVAKEYSNNIQQALLQCKKVPGPISELIYNTLAFPVSMKERERIITENVYLTQKKIEKHVGIIATIATISPMFGLLGTVTGMMKSFSALSRVGNVAQDLLAYGIAEALITTALGLLVAIPAWIFYNYLVSRVERYAKDLEYVANALLDFPVYTIEPQKRNKD
ncbi:MAG TPA: MotA/TolQ/ExbB proton channel family protein [Spirochaetota bacterium]|nr:MotA/TolQ/ExbB proton channel family protein [Spirochaetota bacterium]